VRLSLTKLWAHHLNVIICENEYLIDFASYSSNHTRLVTNHLEIGKLLLVPGPYSSSVSKKFYLDLNVRLWRIPTMSYRMKMSTDASFIGLPMSTTRFIQISSIDSSLSMLWSLYPSQLVSTINFHLLIYILVHG